MGQESVLLMGYPASGKSTVAKGYIDRGYVWLNRDKRGGKVRSLVPEMTKALKRGKSVIIDNTFPTVESRISFVEVAKAWEVPIRCLWLDAKIEEAQFNACLRMVRKQGRLLEGPDYKKSKDPNMFPPAALFKYRKEFQAPTAAEGFKTVERIRFKRKPLGYEYKGKAVIFDFDQTLREVKEGAPYRYPVSPEEVEILPNRRKTLSRYLRLGYTILGVSNQSGVAKGTLTMDTARACFDHTCDLLRVDISYEFCPHRVPPISCWCRKPQVGIGVLFIERFRLDPAQCIMVGDQKTDHTFAKRCGFEYVDQEVFFGG